MGGVLDLLQVSLDRGGSLAVTAYGIHRLIIDGRYFERYCSGLGIGLGKSENEVLDAHF